MNLVLDTGILGQLCHPAKATNRPVSEWVEAILLCDSDDRVYLPEICDYELRRKLLHLIHKGQSTGRSINRLNELGELLDYLPLDTSMMRKAADLWANARSRGVPTAADAALDGDVVLAVQAIAVEGVIVTTNRKHLLQFVPARDRTEILWTYAFVCIRGPVDNLAFDWKGHFMVLDTQGRTWHCRQEATWADPGAIHDTRQLLACLKSDLLDVEPMYQKLFATGHSTNEPTNVRLTLKISPRPIGHRELTEGLAMSLGDDSEGESVTYG